MIATKENFLSSSILVKGKTALWVTKNVKKPEMYIILVPRVYRGGFKTRQNVSKARTFENFSYKYIAMLLRVRAKTAKEAIKKKAEA